MTLTFLGAARMVTGSCYLLEACGKKLLIDCGMRQGHDDDDSVGFDFNPADIDAVVATHAHIDHSGRMPELKKLGFSGRLYATRLTCQLLNIMLRDSAHIQELEAGWKSRKGMRAGISDIEPPYTVADAMALVEQFTPMEYNVTQTIFPGILLRFIDAGHLLGSASVELWISEGDVTKKIVFSGDIGNTNQPIVRDPQHIAEADYVVMESTYGDREHEIPVSYVEDLAALLNGVFAKGGNVIIPAFAVGRTQELLYFLREIKERGLVTNGNFPVYVDSPLANEATRIFSGDLRGFIDESAEELVKNGDCMFCFDNLRLSETAEDSKALNENKTPKVIISASGMCDAGRIRHHLKHNLWRHDSAIVFVGFQSPGTLGRALLDGAKRVKLFGEEIAVNAQIINFKGMSAHAGRSGLIEWAKAFNPSPTEYFITHGDAEVSVIFADTLQELGLRAHAPMMSECYDLAKAEIARAGIPFAPKPKREAETRLSAQFERLLALGKRLVELINRKRGAPNKELNRFSGELQSLIDKWDD